MSKGWVDARVPPPEECVIGPLLERRARETPEKVFALFEDGATWTYAEALDLVQRTAARLRDLGVAKGDFVNVWMPNGADSLRVWLAINWLGAVYVPINLAYRGRLLEHVIANAGAKMMIAHGDLLPRLTEIELAQLEDVVAFGPTPPIAGVRLHGSDAVSPGEDRAQPAEVAPWDYQMVIYTSGTTGPSKGVLVTYLHGYSSIELPFGYTGAEDRFLINLPLFHVSGAGAIMLVLVKGASFAMVSAFSTSEFWSVVRRTQATSCVLLGVMATFLAKEPPKPDERDHTLRSVMMVPLTEDADEFARRFGCEVHTCFNMTEISSPLMAGPNPKPISSCGRPRAGIEARIVDENDCELPAGEVGELILRTDRPWAMTAGYLNNPEATVKAWRNGWFHTGDAFRKDDDGAFYFVDRLKDAIRRRGENISSFEVEAEVCTHPAVKEAAAVAAASEFGEDEVLVVVAPAPGHAVDPAELIEFLIPRMPRFMIPRYVRVLDDLPKTPTQKVQKHLLREQGVTPDTFDREAAGIRLKREASLRA